MKVLNFKERGLQLLNKRIKELTKELGQIKWIYPEKAELLHSDLVEIVEQRNRIEKWMSRFTFKDI